MCLQGIRMVAEMCRAYEQKFNTNNYGVNTLFCQAKKEKRVKRKRYLHQRNGRVWGSGSENLKGKIIREPGKQGRCQE